MLRFQKSRNQGDFQTMQPCGEGRTQENGDGQEEQQTAVIHRLRFSLLFDETGPVCVGLSQVALSVLVEIASDGFAVLKDQAAIHDLKGVHVNFRELVAGNTVSTVTAEVRFVLSGFFIEEFFVFFRGKEVSSAVMLARELRSSFDWLMVGEERDRIVALDGDAGFVEVEQSLGLGQQWGGERCRQ